MLAVLDRNYCSVCQHFLPFLSFVLSFMGPYWEDILMAKGFITWLLEWTSWSTLKSKKVHAENLGVTCHDCAWLLSSSRHCHNSSYNYGFPLSNCESTFIDENNYLQSLALREVVIVIIRLLLIRFCLSSQPHLPSQWLETGHRRISEPS